MKKTHYDMIVGQTACGRLMEQHVKATTDLKRVTCQSCRNAIERLKQNTFRYRGEENFPLDKKGGDER